MFIPVFIDYLHTGLVERFPTLIVSGFIMLLAMLLYLVGLILEIMTNKHRQLYELLLNK
jgi:phosphoribulokinase